MAIENSAGIGSAPADIESRATEVITTRKTAENTNAGDTILFPEVTRGILFTPETIDEPITADEQPRPNEGFSIFKPFDDGIEIMLDKAETVANKASLAFNERNVVGKVALIAETISAYAAIKYLTTGIYDKVLFDNENIAKVDALHAAGAVAIGLGAYAVDRFRGKTKPKPDSSQANQI